MMDKKMFFEMMVLTVLMVAQIALFILFFNYGKVLVLRYFGFFCWALSALFGWLPIYEFKKRGEVPKGRSYISTTKLVTSGVYSVVRHPQFVAGILLSLAFMLISQHWSVLCLGVPVIILLYKDMFDADTSNINKFGKPYETYMKDVPRANFISGFIRVIRGKAG